MISKYVIALSNIVFWGMTMSLSKQSILVHFLGAVICSVWIWYSDLWNCFKKTTIISKVTGLIVTSLILYSIAGHFFRVVRVSNKICTLISSVISSPDAGLIVLSVIGACMAIPFVILLVTCTIEYVLILMKLIWKSEFWKILLNKIKLKWVILGGINIVAAALIAVALMTAVYMIPVDKIEKNISLSAEVIKDETTYPQITQLCTSQLDNWTDSIMLAEAGENQSTSSALNRALLVERGTIEGYSPYESLIGHYVMDKEYDTQIQYPRYWHGYQILLKPLLTFMTYPQIRVLNGVVEIILLIAVCVLFYYRKCSKYIIPWILGYLMLMPIALAKSLQFAPCYYAYTLGSLSILLLSKQKRSQYLGIIFLNIGIFTAFFDFLTYPVIGFCISAAVYFAMDTKRDISVSFMDLLRSGFCWCAGYIGMWASKWILGTVITGTDIIGNAQLAIEERSGHLAKNGIEVFFASDCLLKNVDAFLYTPILLIVAAWIVFIVKKYRGIKAINRIKKIELIFPYLFIGVIPLAWYLVTINHSSIHYWFTNKTLAGLLIPAMIGFVQLKTWKETDEKAIIMESE